MTLTPELLDSWRERMRQDMLAHPQHHLDWRLRRDFYLELGNDTGFKRQFRGWLAVLCLQKVLPILLDVDPQNQSIFDELSAAIAYLKNEDSPHNLQRLIDLSYHGHWLSLMNFYDDFPPRNALAVLMASFKAMQEVKFWELEIGWLDPFETAGMQDKHRQIIPDVTDEEWAGHASPGDAASAAAVAWACRPDSTECDPARLEVFWTWWLDEAWVIDLKLAEKYESTDKRIVPPPAQETPDIYAEMRPQPFGEDDWPDEMK